MQQRLNLILGDQLNWDSLIWKDVDLEQDLFWMAEVSDESTQTPSSKQRTTLFLSAMRHFAEEIKNKGYRLSYTRLTAEHSSFESVLHTTLKNHTFSHVRCVLAGDMRVVTKLEHIFEPHNLSIEWLEDQHFITRRGEFQKWLNERKQPRMEHWYRHLRKDRQILMTHNEEPIGGQWNFDKDNRRSFDKNGPQLPSSDINFKTDAITKHVISDVESFCPDLPGIIDNFNWPVTRGQALKQLDAFIKQRLPFFGDYQDAMWTDQAFLFHARLSSSLNLKLLHPMEVIKKAEQAYSNNKAPLNAVEGFIRQILGWREYIRGLYWSYRNHWLDYNALDNQRVLPSFYWHADTEMQCMHQSISQVLKHGYGHHIQRLMVTGLFSLLWGIKPDEIHRWYLGMYVDAVAWVEIPNTIGMSQYADGGIVGSKPYIASGAYIQRMSNYCEHCQFKPKQAAGDDACPFTTLYWYFIDQHQSWLARNPRLGMQVKNWTNKGDDEQNRIRQRADWLFSHLDERPYKEQA
ncbi:cryptochrome/photolyase family protein [Methylophaga sp.]|uniref:cryptochrome/photolyase family protein n=1 Tax=Methylophaga sp. TaxID=2024840 RepID=UPI003F6A2B22